MPIDLDTVNKDIASNPYLGKSPEELSALKKDFETKLAMQRKQQLMNTISEGATGVGDIFLQRGGLKSPVRTEPKRSVTDEINEFIAKERLKQQIASEVPETASEKLANMKLKEIERRRGGAEQVVAPSAIIPTNTSIEAIPKESIATPISSMSSKENAPSPFIKKSEGFDEYGIEKLVDYPNPAYDTWLKGQEKKQETDIENERKSKYVREATQDTLDTLNEVEKGIDYFGAIGPVPTLNPWDYNRKKWEANVNKLLSGKIIDLMTTMKEASKTGATGFGQLSNKELGVLQEASTALKKGLSPEDAKELLTKMKNKLEKVVNVEQIQSKDDIIVNQLLDQLGAE
jgi:hypothetical protein